MYKKVRESIYRKREEKDCLPAKSFLFALVIFSCKKYIVFKNVHNL